MSQVLSINIYLLVHTRSGFLYFRNAFERCGLMCLLLREFDRVRTKEEVNIVATMMHLKDKNPQLIPNYVRAIVKCIRLKDHNFDLVKMKIFKLQILWVFVKII